MSAYCARKRLPSCEVSRSLLQQLESYLDQQINSLFGKKLARMKELYGHHDVSSLKDLQIQIQEADQRRVFSTTGKIPGEQLPNTVRRVGFHMRFGQPELLNVRLEFPYSGRPVLEVSTLRKDQQKTCQKFAEGILSLLRHWTNNNWAVRSKPMLIAIAALPPISLAALGLLKGLTPFSAMTVQGWTLFFSIGLAFCFERLFPLVRFRTDRGLRWTRIKWVLLLGLALAATTAYITLVLFHWGLLSQ